MYQPQKATRFYLPREEASVVQERFQEGVFRGNYDHYVDVLDEKKEDVQNFLSEQNLKLRDTQEISYFDITTLKENAYYKIKFTFRKQISKIKTATFRSYDKNLPFAYVKGGRKGRNAYVLSESVTTNIEFAEEIPEEEALKPSEKTVAFKLKQDAFEAGDVVEFYLDKKGERKRKAFVMKKSETLYECVGFRRRERSTMHYYNFRENEIAGVKKLNEKETKHFFERMKPFPIFTSNQHKIKPAVVLTHYNITVSYDKKEKLLTLQKEEETYQVALNAYNKESVIENLYKRKDENLKKWLEKVDVETVMDYLIEEYANRLKTLFKVNEVL